MRGQARGRRQQRPDRRPHGVLAPGGEQDAAPAHGQQLLDGPPVEARIVRGGRTVGVHLRENGRRTLGCPGRQLDVDQRGGAAGGEEARGGQAGQGGVQLAKELTGGHEFAEPQPAPGRHQPQPERDEAVDAAVRGLPTLEGVVRPVQVALPRGGRRECQPHGAPVVRAGPVPRADAEGLLGLLDRRVRASQPRIGQSQQPVPVHGAEAGDLGGLADDRTLQQLDRALGASVPQLADGPQARGEATVAEPAGGVVHGQRLDQPVGLPGRGQQHSGVPEAVADGRPQHPRGDGRDRAARLGQLGEVGLGAVEVVGHGDEVAPAVLGVGQCDLEFGLPERRRAGDAVELGEQPVAVG